ALDHSIYEIVLSGLGDIGNYLSRYESLAKNSELTSKKDLDEFSRLTEQLDLLEGWDLKHRVDKILSDLNLDGLQDMNSSSGGMRRRAMLAKALVSNPELLLLDEPTNHLDIEAIDELQQTLMNLDTALVLVSHDRSLIDAVATRIVEIDRGQLTSYPGSFAEYQVRKDKENEEELVSNKLFDKQLAKEESWIREGIKARRTRNEGRVRRLEQMRRERSQREQRQGNVKLSIEEGQKSGSTVVEFDQVEFSYEEKILNNFSSLVRRGDRIGVIGRNGSGKSTLLKLMLGEMSPDSGTIKLGTNLEVAYFDQQRESLDSSKTVKDSVADGNDYVQIGGERRHVVGYLGDFLFSPHYMNAKVSRLSGGEKNRLLLAKLFAKPANLLVLDEPTNDLDIETLELLEELLTDFQGTVVLVSHDRAFLDGIVTSTMVFEEGKGLNEYVGGYSDWQKQSRKATQVKSDPVNNVLSEKPLQKNQPKKNNKRLGFNERRELEDLPGRIEALESELEALSLRMGAADFYAQDGDAIKLAGQRLAELNEELESAYLRWEALSEREETTEENRRKE
ncbi:MAG: hypothetical protein CBE21_10795, partial [Proteobacteria bacterium TMED261]